MGTSPSPITITPDSQPTGTGVTITPDAPPKDTLSNINANMTAAMSGQRMQTPQDQQQFDAGKKSGTINATVDTGLGAAGGLAIPEGLSALEGAMKYLGIGAKAAANPETKQVATGILDEFGNPIMRAVEPEVRPVMNKILSHPEVQAAMTKAAKSVLLGTVGAVGGHYGLKLVQALLSD